MNGPASRPLAPSAVAFAVHLRPARPLFATVFPPVGTWSGRRVVLCPPLGYEGLFAGTTLSFAAAHLARETRAVVLVLDYDGTGDSSGTDRDAGRVRGWLDSIHEAVTWLQANARSSSPVAVVGLRSGAVLAAVACGERTEPYALGLWAGQATGRSFVREQRAFSALTTAPDGGKDEAARGFETNGFFFSAETTQDLERLRIGEASVQAPTHLLAIQRSEMPVANLIPARWREPEARCEISEESTGDFNGLMQAPWLWEAPVASTEVLVRWVNALPADQGATLGPIATTESSAVVAAGVTEIARRVGRSNLMAIVTLPTVGDPKAMLLLVGATVGYRIGHTRLHVEMARRLAEVGIASVRFDVTGVGANRGTGREGPPLPYEPQLTEDVDAALEWAWDSGHRRLAMHGVCAGAFHAWRAALASELPVRLVVANLEEYWPIRYTLTEHQRTLAPPDPITMRIRAARRPGELWRLGIELFGKLTKRVLALVRASAPIGMHRSSFPTLLARLGGRRSSTSLLYSAGDQGIALYHRHLGRHRTALEANGTVALTIVEGADHSVTSFAARSAIVEATVTDLLRWLSSKEK